MEKNKQKIIADNRGNMLFLTKNTRWEKEKPADLKTLEKAKLSQASLKAIIYSFF